MTYDIDNLTGRIARIPKENFLFLPTPLRKLENFSKKYGVNLFVKHEEATGPNVFGGNKTRKLEYILADAKLKGISCIISTGAYQTNAGVQMTSCCRAAGLKPILFLADLRREGVPEEYKGNMLLNKIMGCELHLVAGRGAETQFSIYGRCGELAEARKKELKAQGIEALILPPGVSTPVSWVSYVTVMIEIQRQLAQLGAHADFCYGTNGTGGTFPGLIAGKLLLGLPAKLIDIAVDEGTICPPEEIVRRVQSICETLGAEIPDSAVVEQQFEIDRRFFGEKYTDPTESGARAIRELAELEGLLLDPVYSGKVMAGILAHIESGAIPPLSNVVYIHTGGTGALFSGRSHNELLFETFEEDVYVR